LLARRFPGKRPDQWPLPAGELHDWLVRSGFADDGDGLLRPTDLGLEVAAALTRDLLVRTTV
jgi:hypothetical protein